ncbi:hypothetical protein G7067_07385 [Leucobacter insecticola]|uniref:Uncharacterized protein n=1 Tax=Leucobacter insecticola TaxID=2714934 RepID=A0A6G8FJ27_9MICO|nr:hypothetical protein [Leucobacter insecticola]QIM16289.1 hypothetical protein G7067_07385 [Leucobacter insecticola]
MDLKFSFGGATPDHDHGSHGEAGQDPALTGVPLPFTVTPASKSSVLEVHVRCSDTQVIAEAVSGDSVTYARSEVDEAARDPAALARAVSSATARVVAGLEGPLAEAVSGVILSLGGSEQAVVVALGFGNDVASPLTSEAFQRRTGVTSGTPVHIA